MLFREYISLLGLSGWYAEWSRVNLELAKRLEGAPLNPTAGQLERLGTSRDCVAFQGELVAVKARIQPDSLVRPDQPSVSGLYPLFVHVGPGIL